MNKRAAVIGGGVVDIPLAPVDAAVFQAHSTPLARIAMQAGGDAVNESVALSRLGHPPLLVSKVGDDAAGDFLLRTLAREGVDVSAVVREAGLDTGINVVLVRPDGERCFITNRNGSLRRLGPADIRPALDDPAFEDVKVACLASLFVSPMLSIADTASLLDALKARGVLLCADTTRPKHGETADDLAPVLARLDYFFPNRDEAAMLTGEAQPEAMADAFLEKGLGCAVIKLGREGCLLRGRDFSVRVPARTAVRCVDTTGAGDTFAAGFIAGLLEDRTPLDCARLGAAAASLCVEAVGATAGLKDRAAVDVRLAGA